MSSVPFKEPSTTCYDCSCLPSRSRHASNSSCTSPYTETQLTTGLYIYSRGEYDTLFTSFQSRAPVIDPSNHRKTHQVVVTVDAVLSHHGPSLHPTPYPHFLAFPSSQPPQNAEKRVQCRSKMQYLPQEPQVLRLISPPHTYLFKRTLGS